MTAYIGQIKLFAFDFVPKGWLKCDGSLLLIRDYVPLFTYLGRAYSNQTDPAEQFRLPDLRGTVPIHRGRGNELSNNYILGRVVGSATYTMKPENLPVHTHRNTHGTLNFSPPCSTNPGNTMSPSNAYPAATPGKDTYASKNAGKSCETKLTSENVTVDTIGGGQPFSLLQPCIGLNYFICESGLFPTQP